jgi:adenylate cyclase
MEFLDKKVVDFIQKSKQETINTTEIAIADIDTKSIDHYGRWPWGRDIMAVLLHELESYYEVKILGYDITFAERDPNDVTTEKILDQFSERINLINQDGILQEKIESIRSDISSTMKNDLLFANELRKWDNVVQGYFMFSSSDRVEHLKRKDLEASVKLIEDAVITIVESTAAIDDFTHLPIYTAVAVEPNIALLTIPNSTSGYLNAFPDLEDGTIRRVHLVMRYGKSFFPSLDLQILRLYYGNPPIRMVLNEVGIDQIQLGEKIIKTDSDGSTMINYRGPSFTFPHFSAYDIIEHKIPQGKLKNKIVLLGASEIGVSDLKITPMGAAFPGTEIHANLLDNILKDDYYLRTNFIHLFTFLLIVIFGLLMGIVLPHLSALTGAMGTISLLSAYLLVNLWSLEKNKQWTSFTYIVGVIVINWFAIVLYRYFSEEKDKRFIRSAFQQYLAPEVIRQLVDNPRLLKLGGEKRQLTALFSDIQGFSTIAEVLTPEELVELLNEYLTAMTDIIMRYGGTVDKFEGDAIIAFFGAPISYDDHALRACLASLEMQETMVTMRENWKQQGRHELYVRIGLNTGEMVVGNMGSAYRMDYTMIGDAVNLAARLEKVNKEYKTSTMLSNFTYEQIKDTVETRELDLIRVVGKREPIKIYELLGRKDKLSANSLKAYYYFQRGLQLYRQQNWAEARKYFAHCNRLLDGDGVSQIFFSRCKKFQTSPPQPDWDGVFQMLNK